MTTEIYGASDDLIEFEGDVTGETGHIGCEGDDPGVLVVCSDGTLLQVKYGKGQRGIWCVTLLHRGSLFENIAECTDEDAERHSDTAHFNAGLKWAYAATAWEPVK